MTAPRAARRGGAARRHQRRALLPRRRAREARGRLGLRLRRGRGHGRVLLAEPPRRGRRRRREAGDTVLRGDGQHARGGPSNMLVDALLVFAYRLAGQASKLVDSDACPRPYDRSSRRRSTSWSGPARRGGYAPSAFPTVDRFCMALSHGCAGRLAAHNGDFRPGQSASRCPTS